MRRVGLLPLLCAALLLPTSCASRPAVDGARALEQPRLLLGLRVRVLDAHETARDQVEHALVEAVPLLATFGAQQQREVVQFATAQHFAHGVVVDHTLEHGSQGVDVAPLYGDLSPAEQDRAIAASPAGRR